MSTRRGTLIVAGSIAVAAGTLACLVILGKEAPYLHRRVDTATDAATTDRSLAPRNVTARKPDSRKTEAGTRVAPPIDELVGAQGASPRPSKTANESAGEIGTPKPFDSGFDLTAESAAKWRTEIGAACAGQDVTDCDHLMATFAQVLAAPDELDDGWSSWMEGQIQASLNERAVESNFLETGTKCSADACVFYFATRSRNETFHSGFQYANEFHRWLRRQPWNDWLETHTKSTEEATTLAWRLIGRSTTPFFNWYVVTRRQ